MKLAKALKRKNKLAGEIAQAQALISASNVVEGTNQPPHDVIGLYKGLVETQQELAALKAKIARANGPIWDKILTMAEAKARIAFLRALPVKEGTFEEGGRYMAAARTVSFHSTLKAVWVEAEVKKLSDHIESLQDDIDEFNAKTEV